LSVAFTPTDSGDYSATSASVAIGVTKATPTITWSAPANIVYGTALGATQLNATANVAGTFAYTPPAGTVLSVGGAQTLSVAFTPTDSGNFSATSASVAISVTKATPTITWSAPASIVYGTALSATQLNATASVPGTFSYSPAAGAFLSAGAAQTLSATFAPTDSVNYSAATTTVAISVAKATPTISWPPPANIVYGILLGPAQLNATPSVPGTLVYTPPGGTLLPVGSGQILTATLTPADGVNYASVTATVPITVLPAIPAIDVTVWADQATALPTITSPAFTTTAPNELLLAFVATDYDTGTNTSVTSITGGGLTWTLVARANAQPGTSEIWRALAPAPLSAVTVTAAMSQPVSAMLTVVTIVNVDTTGDGSGAIGAVATASRSGSTPSATVVTTRNNSLVFGVANDYDHAASRTVGAGQTMVHQFLSPVGDTYWLQRQLNPTALAGTSVMINDTAPSGDRSNLAVCEIRPPQ